MPETQALRTDSPQTQPPPESIAERLVPKNLRERKFRAHSFYQKLNRLQRDTLLAWMKVLSTREIVEKVAAPPPAGFGLEVSPTTIDRLKALHKNTAPVGLALDAMETAADLLQEHQPANIAALHEALHVMLYSAAVNQAARAAEPKLIDQTLVALTRLQKLRILAAAGAPAQHPPSGPATRHHIHLTVAPVERPGPSVVENKTGRSFIRTSTTSESSLSPRRGEGQGEGCSST